MNMKFTSRLFSAALSLILTTYASAQWSNCPCPGGQCTTDRITLQVERPYSTSIFPWRSWEPPQGQTIFLPSPNMDLELSTNADLATLRKFGPIGSERQVPQYWYSIPRSSEPLVPYNTQQLQQSVIVEPPHPRRIPILRRLQEDKRREGNRTERSGPLRRLLCKQHALTGTSPLTVAICTCHWKGTLA